MSRFEPESWYWSCWGFNLQRKCRLPVSIPNAGVDPAQSSRCKATLELKSVHEVEAEDRKLMWRRCIMIWVVSVHEPESNGHFAEWDGRKVWCIACEVHGTPDAAVDSNEAWDVDEMELRMIGRGEDQGSAQWLQARTSARACDPLERHVRSPPSELDYWITSQGVRRRSADAIRIHRDGFGAGRAQRESAITAKRRDQGWRSSRPRLAVIPSTESRLAPAPPPALIFTARPKPRAPLTALELNGLDFVPPPAFPSARSALPGKSPKTVSSLVPLLLLPATVHLTSSHPSSSPPFPLAHVCILPFLPSTFTNAHSISPPPHMRFPRGDSWVGYYAGVFGGVASLRG
ncbi:hypothetical protein B0H17DRAFT_1138947 [Mycena rosella]|uniref:Uncharacterized protein n=1 Tax=Mycena rosella TaxID=1033263 RepID=A0AAD7G934_MYCRO|nr:hypothetical protein B0H17DRAFT_1138947 [Mycena rosella]